MPTVGVIEGRRWVPKYRATIITESGRTLAVRHFWFKRHAREWMLSYTVQHVYPQF